jgi:serine phosphatase RsbU (regulator of sigma subunit)
MLRVASGQPGYSVSTGPRGVEALAIGDLVIPTQSDGTVWMHYARHDPRRFVSAAQVLAGSVDPSRLARKLVLIGVTAFGLGDAHATPVGHRMAGVEIHAQLLEAIFEGSLLIRPRFMARAEAALIALGGLLLVATVPRLALRHSLAVLAGLLVGAATLALAAYGFLRYLFDAVLPMLSLAVVFTGMLGVTLAESRRQRRALRRQLEAEREAAARLSGELAAARRIQMGILPDPATAFPGETRFTLYAFLEPARMVGGDLYDFFALDEDRLFFLIGDVSGKGVPGSLFMAVCKSLYKSAVLRQARDVGGIMREANLEISRNNPESLFVAVFAGVLNTRTGELEYCNAGHDDPYLLGRHGRPPGRLQQGGGPPLCAMDHFPYTAASHRLQPGDVLCLVTDGVVEATNGAGELYRRSRLEALLAECPADGTPAEVGEAIRRDVSRFAAGAEPWDDMAILVLRWDGPDGTRGRAAA